MIKNLGHQISIHFDPLNGNLKKEIKLFESFYNTRVEIISFHRPKLDQIKKLNLNHTYEDKYFNSIKYFSDSTGSFRFGHPLESNEFKNFNSIQLLIHPIWWISKEKNVIDIIKGQLKKNKEMINLFFLENSNPYKNYIQNKYKK